jgi:endo-1,4-beta-xylanase
LQARPAAPTTLREAAQARDFLIGGTIAASSLRNDSIYGQFLPQQYNVVEPEVETRLFRVHPSRTEFNFDDADAVVDFASAHGMKVRGLYLVVDNLLPDWLTKGNLSPSEVSEILKDYIQTMLRRYRGRIYSWDIAWAAFDNLGKIRQSFWLKTVGADYIEQVIG